jgi:hypothetical protein
MFSIFWIYFWINGNLLLQSTALFNPNFRRYQKSSNPHLQPSLRLLSTVKENEKEIQQSSEYDGDFYDDEWKGNMEGFDWQMERARRFLEGPTFSPLRMTLWQPLPYADHPEPTFLDHFKILLNNALQIAGVAESLDGAPLVQGVNTFKGSPFKLLAKVIDGDLAELAGGPLFLLLRKYYQQYGSIYKLAFGPKSFIVVSDPIIVKHILKENPQKYDKGILAEILKPVMGKVLLELFYHFTFSIESFKFSHQ